MARVYTISQKVMESRKQNGFQKGCTPWNEGLAGTHVTGGTEFKKGVPSWNKGMTVRTLIECVVCSSPIHCITSKLGRQKCCSRKCFYKYLLKTPKLHHTSIEVKVYNTLKDMGVRFIEQHIINDKFRVDAYVPDKNLVIECDGDYWHSLENIQKRDKVKNAYLTKCGYKMIRLPEHDIRSGKYLSQLEEVLVG
jgi:very-short-patch-repair endonuclease